MPDTDYVERLCFPLVRYAIPAHAQRAIERLKRMRVPFQLIQCAVCGGFHVDVEPKERTIQ